MTRRTVAETLVKKFNSTALSSLMQGDESERVPLQSSFHTIVGGAAVGALAFTGLAGIAGADLAVGTIGPGASSNTAGVICVQQALGIPTDGKFGQRTYQAVSAFQQANNLSPDGAVGRMTGEKLLPSAPAGCQRHIPSTSSSQPAAEVPDSQRSGSYKYVALGDSFSAGEGIEPFFEPADKCHRSTLAYPTYVRRPGSTGASIYELAKFGTPGLEQGSQWGFLACSGAKTSRVSDELAPDPRRKDPQNSNALPVDTNTDLVTLTIGGDNVDFADILQRCAQSSNCTTEKYNGRLLKDIIGSRLTALGPELDRVYAQIHTIAPKARIIVAGYPQLFPKSPAEQNCGKLGQKTISTFPVHLSVGFSQPEQNFLRDQDNRLNDFISTHVLKFNAEHPINGQIVIFVPVAGYFKGHEICGNSGEWINGPTYSGIQLDVNDQSFHPTDDGQRLGYATAINDTIKNLS